MDHNLDDSLNLDSEMGVDFEPPGDVEVSQADITLDADTHGSSMPMEFEPIEEQAMLMDTENEQIIGYSDDQFTLQEYGMGEQHEQTGANTTVITSEPSMSQSDTMIDIQFDPQTLVSNTVSAAVPTVVKQEPQAQPKYISVRAASMPRQVAIAPKPPRGAPPATLKQITLAPKPVALAPSRPGLVKKVSIAGLVQGSTQGTTVLAQLGKQLLMVPAGSNQKIKLVAASSAVPNIQYIRTNQGEQAQMIASKTVSGTAKPMLTKFIVQAPSGDPSNQPAVITKLAPTQRFVTMTQKTVPISMPNKVFVTSPAKQTVRITKKPQFVEIKSPTPKLVPTVSTSGGTKKVVITATPTSKVIYKPTVQNKPTQVNSGNATGQKTQLHQIHVPGKGIQYIRLVTSAPQRPKPEPAPPAPGKTIVLTNSKGNVIQLTTDKRQSGQPPPLVITGAQSLGKCTRVYPTATEAVAAKPQQKLVRIAPVGSKPAIAAAAAARSSQSLLAPISPARSPTPPPVELEEIEVPVCEPEVDSKAALKELLATAEPPPPALEHELEVEFETQQSTEEPDESNSASEENSQSFKESLEEPLIVIPNYLKPREVIPEDTEEAKRYNNYEAQSFNSYQTPTTPRAMSENELAPQELGLRPRKACNCTKSQCLKLYCDCFANGEFCNRCNCNNCHNNLENEELRQKAIRGCLDRNPNAFRPKIGKAKSGGPEIVRRHNKGCNCKRSGCLKNYCECYEAKIACTAMCKCVGCRNVEDTLERRRRDAARAPVFRPPALPQINFMTTEVIEAVCQCLLAAAGEPCAGAAPPDPARDVIDEFSRCLQDIINAAHHSSPILDESRA